MICPRCGGLMIVESIPDDNGGCLKSYVCEKYDSHEMIWIDEDIRTINGIVVKKYTWTERNRI